MNFCCFLWLHIRHFHENDIRNGSNRNIHNWSAYFQNLQCANYPKMRLRLFLKDFQLLNPVVTLVSTESHSKANKIYWKNSFSTKTCYKIFTMKGILFKTYYRVLCKSNGKSHVSLIKMSDIIVKTYFGKNDHHW